jgi:hypothetical protein
MLIQVKKSNTFQFYLNGRVVQGQGTIKGQIEFTFNGRQIKNAFCEWFEEDSDFSFKTPITEDEADQACYEAFLILEGLDCEVSLDN